MVNLVLHVPVFSLLRFLLHLPSGSRRTQDGHFVQLEELLTQAVLQVLVQLAAGRKNKKRSNWLVKYPQRQHSCCLTCSQHFWSDTCLSCVFLPAGRLYEVLEELLVTREGRRRARPDHSMRLNETLLQTLQTAQTVGAQHAKQVSVGSISRGAVHTGVFTHLKVTGIDGMMQPHF